MPNVGDFEDSFDVAELRHRVTYRVQVTTVDTLNQRINAWNPLGTFWAKVEPLSGMELMNARTLKATTSHKILMRNVNSVLAALVPPRAITPSGQFLFEGTGRIFGIEQVFRVNEQNAFLSIHCSELITPQ